MYIGVIWRYMYRHFTGVTPNAISHIPHRPPCDLALGVTPFHTTYWAHNLTLTPSRSKMPLILRQLLHQLVDVDTDRPGVCVLR